MEVHFDGHCFGCGPLNPDGLQLKFEPVEDGSSVASYEVPPRFQSWAGMAHGGIVSLMLDEAVGWAAWHAGHPGVTGRLTWRKRSRSMSARRRSRSSAASFSEYCFCR